LDRDRYALQGDEAPWFAAGSRKATQVGLHFTIRFERFEHSVEDRSRCCLLRKFNAVVHPLSFSPSCHDTCLTQVCQMPGDLGLALSQNFNQIADAHLTTANQIQQTQPRAVGNSL